MTLERSQPRTILIVDDQSINRKLMRAVLEAEQFKVVEAADGVDGLALLKREPIDAIISDILMPRMDGYRFCREVRQSEKHRTLPLIIYTSTYTSPGDEKCALNSGADKYIRKPAPARTLLDGLEELLTGKRVRAATPTQAPEELEVMKEYSEALVRKLEERSSEFQLASEQLAQTNRVLSSQARELERAKEQLRNSNEELEKRVQ